MPTGSPRAGGHLARVGLLTLVLLAAAGHPARGHGGQFRAPPGVPPSGPGLGPAPVPAAITPGDTWQTYWDLNRMGLIPDRDEVLRRQTITPRGEDEGAVREGWARRRLTAARQTVIPFLLRLADPKRKTRDEVRAAALIALGKICQDRVASAFFLHYLHDPKEKPLVRESAALAIGLLRRSQPSLQRTGEELDALREELVKALDDEEAHVRVRGFAALAIGLLADQPYGTPYTKDGRMMIRALWKRFGPKPKGMDVPVAMLTALGMQPPAGVPDAVREGLRQITAGKRIHGRRWSPAERSHALTALARLGGPGAHSLLLAVLRRPSEPVELRRAAYLALGRMATGLCSEERAETAKVVVDSLRHRRDPLTTGLGLIAAGRLLGADLHAGEIQVLDATKLHRLLLSSAREASLMERGYAVLALAFGADGARASGLARPFLAEAKQMMLHGLEKGRGDDVIRAAYAVGLGMLEVQEGIPLLLDVVRDTGAMPVLRGHAAVALGQIGRRRDEVRPVLQQLLREKRGVLLRVRAAMALALIGGSLVRTQLLDELKQADSEYHRAHVVIALGRLGDLRAISDLLAYAQDERYSELARALAVVALGMITDPEPRPSILKLSEYANFPAATQVLYSAYSIF